MRQVFSKNLRKQRTLKYQKNYIQLLFNSTENSNVKTWHKNNAEFILTHASS